MGKYLLATPKKFDNPFCKKYFNHLTNEPTDAGRLLLSQLRTGIKRFLSRDNILKLFRDDVKINDLNTDNAQLLVNCFWPDDIEELYNFYTDVNIKPYTMKWYHDMFFYEACEMIWREEKSFLMALLNNQVKRADELKTAEDVFSFYDCKPIIISQFINYYIDKSTTFIPRLRQLTENKPILKKSFKEINATAIINFLIENNIFNLDAENNALINKIILPYISSQQAIIAKTTFKLSTNEFIKLINEYSDKEIIFKHIKRIFDRYNRNIHNNQIDDMAELKAANIAIGKSIKLSELFYDSIHKLTVVPILYVNGNFLKGTSALFNDIATANENVRQYHMHLAKDYLFDMSLHTNDIIKMSPEEWKKQDIYGLLGMGDVKVDIPVGEGVLYNDICVISIIPRPQYNDQVINAYKSYHSKNLFIQNDHGTEVTRLASRLARKQLITKLK